MLNSLHAHVMMKINELITHKMFNRIHVYGYQISMFPDANLQSSRFSSKNPVASISSPDTMIYCNSFTNFIFISNESDTNFKNQPDPD